MSKDDPLFETWIGSDGLIHKRLRREATPEELERFEAVIDRAPLTESDHQWAAKLIAEHPEWAE